MNANWTARDIPRLDGKLALVTGANRGLGLEIATRLALAGATVELACRDLAKGQLACAHILRLAPHAKVISRQIDLADLPSIHSFAQAFNTRGAALDILCHNAGAIMLPSFQKTEEGFERQMVTNYLGSFALTGLLMPSLEAARNARVVSNSSMAHRMVKGIDLDDLNGESKPYKVMQAYGRSKLASLLFAFELARRLQKAQSKVTSVAAHPGIANTNPGTGSLAMRIIGSLLAQTPAMGALPALYAATAPTAANGDYIGPGGFNELRGFPRKVSSSIAAQDRQSAGQLWTLAERLTGVRYELAAA
ncbi:MAG TPA: oxidoreductase [Steroidobacteraceae bacterium]